jgi:hypothetical protein
MVLLAFLLVMNACAVMAAQRFRASLVAPHREDCG